MIPKSKFQSSFAELLMKKKICISTINYFGSLKTIKFIDSLVKFSDDYYFKVLILDNSDPPEVLELRSKLSPYEGLFSIQVLCAGSNLGFGRGHNYVVSFFDEDDQDFLMIINNDVEVIDENFFRVLIQEVKECNICAPIIINSRTNEVWSAGGVLSGITGDLKVSKNSCSKKIEFLSGCCLALRFGVYRKLGGFREDFFMYAEDLDFSLRATASGFNLKVSEIFLNHDIGSGVSGGYSDIYLFENTRNRLICLIDHKIGIPVFSQFFFVAKYIIARSLQLMIYSSNPFRQIKIVFSAVISGCRYILRR